MKVSVIVPVYNVEKYLNKCVDSIINQTYKNLEIILVDDGSKDSSGEICDQYAAQDKRIRVIHKKNGGASDARNLGLENATGEYIGFIDSDDWIEVDMYEKMIQFAHTYETDIVCCGRYNVYGDIKKTGLCPKVDAIISDTEMFERLFDAKECDVSSCDKIYRKSILSDVRYPVGETNEDAAVIYSIVSNAKKIGLLSQPLYNYNHREGSVTTSRINEKRFVIIKNAKNLVDRIKLNYPSLGTKAEVYYAKKMIEAAVIINKAERSDRIKYKGIYSEALNEVRKRFWQLSYTDRIKYLLLYMRIYRYVYVVLRKKIR